MHLIARHTINAVGNQSPATFRFQTIGLGSSGNDFQTLEAMAARVNTHVGSGVAEFHMCSLNQRALTSALSSFSSTVTESILTVTNTTNPREARRLRQVVKSASDIAWKSHRQVRSYLSPKSLGAMFEPMKDRFDVRISETPFDEGGERYVYNFGKVDANGKTTTEKWIAKKNKHIEFGSKELDFHRLNMVRCSSLSSSQHPLATNIEFGSKELDFHSLNMVRCTFYGRNPHSRMPLVPTPLLRFKRTCV